MCGCHESHVGRQRRAMPSLTRLHIPAVTDPRSSGQRWLRLGSSRVGPAAGTCATGAVPVDGVQSLTLPTTDLCDGRAPGISSIVAATIPPVRLRGGGVGGPGPGPAAGVQPWSDEQIARAEKFAVTDLDSLAPEDRARFSIVGAVLVYGECASPNTNGEFVPQYIDGVNMFAGVGQASATRQALMPCGPDPKICATNYLCESSFAVRADRYCVADLMTTMNQAALFAAVRAKGMPCPPFATSGFGEGLLPCVRRGSAESRAWLAGFTGLVLKRHAALAPLKEDLPTYVMHFAIAQFPYECISGLGWHDFPRTAGPNDPPPPDTGGGTPTAPTGPGPMAMPNQERGEWA